MEVPYVAPRHYSPALPSFAVSGGIEANTDNSSSPAIEWRGALPELRPRDEYPFNMLGLGPIAGEPGGVFGMLRYEAAPRLLEMFEAGEIG